MGHSRTDAQTAHRFPRNMPQKGSFQEQIILSNILREEKKSFNLLYHALHLQGKFLMNNGSEEI